LYSRTGFIERKQPLVKEKYPPACWKHCKQQPEIAQKNLQDSTMSCKAKCVSKILLIVKKPKKNFWPKPKPKMVFKFFFIFAEELLKVYSSHLNWEA
jgi:hypothetical protein